MRNYRTGEKARAEILAYLSRYEARNGYPPSVRAMAKAICYSEATVRHHLTILEQRGQVARDERGWLVAEDAA